MIIDYIKKWFGPPPEEPTSVIMICMRNGDEVMIECPQRLINMQEVMLLTINPSVRSVLLGGKY